MRVFVSTRDDVVLFSGFKLAGRDCPVHIVVRGSVPILVNLDMVQQDRQE